MIRNALTVDVEDWYSSSLALAKAPLSAYGQRPANTVVTNTQKLMDLLDEYGHRATFFVLGTVAEYYPDLVREIHGRGHEVGVHGYAHRLAYEMTPGEFEADLSRALELTAGAVGGSDLVIRGFRAPYFSLTRQHGWALDILLKHGICYDSSIFPVRRGLYGDPSAPTSPYVLRNDGNNRLWEFPPATLRVLGQNVPISGGGYLRLFPYAFIEWAIRRENSSGRAVVFYVHPYELDATDVKKEAGGARFSRLTAITQVLGRGAVEGKMRLLLSQFRFGPVGEVFDL